jgi:outer membrane protein assembly factor BamB
MNGIVTRPVYSEGNLVLVNSTTIQAVSPESGSVLWEAPNNASVRAVAANPGMVFILTADFRDPSRVTLRAIGPRSGELIWKKEMPDHQVYDLLLLTEEAVAVAAREPSGVTVLDAATGRLRFRVEMEPRTLYREPFLVDSDKLFVVHANQQLDLYDMSSGQKLWETRLPRDRYFRSAIPVAGGIFLTDMQEHLLVVNADDGSLRWTVDPDQDALLQYQGEVADANRVCVIRRREKTGFYVACAHDLRTGEVLWQTPLLKSKSATPSPILTERYVVYHMNSYDFSQSAWTSKSVFLDKATGQVEQEIAPDELLGFFTYAFLRDGIYTLNARGRVAAFGK